MPSGHCLPSFFGMYWRQVGDGICLPSKLEQNPMGASTLYRFHQVFNDTGDIKTYNGASFRMLSDFLLEPKG
jgi:hypothetical protein